MTTQTRMTNFVRSGEHVEYFTIDVEVSVANTSATSETTTKGANYVIVTVEQPELALTEEEYPSLAAIWDNEFDAAYDDM